MLLRRLIVTVFTIASGVFTAHAHAAEYVQILPGQFVSVLATDADFEANVKINANLITMPGATQVPAFSIRVTPVTNGEFLAFVKANASWRRDRVARTFADGGYLQHWEKPLELGASVTNDQPVTQVSWFAAQAFCESEGGRLPTWYEWEYVAAADEAQPDARGSAAWRAKILGWYAKPATNALSAVGGPKNYYGVQNTHGLIWEWVDDFNALLVSADSRNQGDPDRLQFCGAGAISLRDRDNYAVLMRIALLSSLNAVDSTSSLGFRCVRPGDSAANSNTGRVK
jgi:formylglycine-generating enzyme